MPLLTMRSKITVRWTTNPADLGYDGVKSNWLTQPGEVMSLRKAAEFRVEDIVGQGVYHRVQLTHRGVPVTRDDLYAVIWDAENAASRRRYK